MLLLYIMLGTVAGLIGSLYLFVNEATYFYIAGTFVIVSQVIFWGGLFLNIANDRFRRRFLSAVDDDDIVNNPEYLSMENLPARAEMKYLVVDDDEISLLIMKEMLATLGHTNITTCISAHDALDAIGRSDVGFDCLFLDIEMPKMDGVELCEAIRAQSAYENIPIIMVTVKTGREHVKAAFSAGASDYIAKPYSIDELKSRLSAMRVAANKDKPCDGVDRLVSLNAMDNFLLQIERGGLFATNILTVKIEDFEYFQGRTTSSELKTILRECAIATLASLSDTDALVAYAGNGIFACVTNTRTVNVASLERRISEGLDFQFCEWMPIYSQQQKVTVSTMQSISLKETDGESVFRLHCKIFDAAEPSFYAHRNKNAGM